jgi:hypothetical protein
MQKSKSSQPVVSQADKKINAAIVANTLMNALIEDMYPV